MSKRGKVDPLAVLYQGKFRSLRELDDESAKKLKVATDHGLIIMPEAEDRLIRRDELRQLLLANPALRTLVRDLRQQREANMMDPEVGSQMFADRMSQWHALEVPATSAAAEDQFEMEIDAIVDGQCVDTVEDLSTMGRSTMHTEQRPISEKFPTRTSPGARKPHRMDRLHIPQLKNKLNGAN